ncbi:MAG: AEC family transporter [Caldilineae bacterium]|nr:MAG: AEC family transporter [Caldilineae bacterium]
MALMLATLLSSLSHVLTQVLGPILLVAAAGYLLRRRLQVDVRSVSRVVFYILAPSLIYTSIVTLDFDAATAWRSLGYYAVYMLMMGLIAYGLTRLWGYNGALGSAFVMCAILLNNGNYGLPLNLFAFGPEGFGYALVFFMFNSLVGTTTSIYLLARGEDGARVALRRTLKTPVVWAIFLGLISRSTGLVPSGALMDMLQLVGRAAIPTFLIVLGMTLAQTDARTNLRPVTRLSALRMAGGPIVAIVLSGLFGLGGVVRSVAILQGSMSTAVNSIVISNEFEAAPDFVAGSVFSTTLLSIITLPALLLWLM